ncbi:fimbrial protein [Proteus mirabilis]|uniref:fimbrial protein n=1 Tax=Proteus mirabilis TaxID=584 RepID=UPI000F890287|nr:fimbrial protein [Proteus mirabilis]RUL13053.1 hypothetical protein ELP66_03805 [Proteus mirabilis]
MYIYKIMIMFFLFLFSLLGNANQKFGTKIYMHGNLLTAPPCKVNNGNVIDVGFGPISTKSIKGYDQKRELNYKITCESNSNNLKTYLWINGDKSNFDINGLKTNIDDLAIKFMMGGDIIELNKKYTVDINHPEQIWAVLVKKENSVLKTGDFSSSGTLFVEYQ